MPAEGQKIYLTDFTLTALRERVQELRQELHLAEIVLRNAEQPGELHDRLTAEEQTADGR